MHIIDSLQYQYFSIKLFHIPRCQAIYYGCASILSASCRECQTMPGRPRRVVTNFTFRDISRLKNIPLFWLMWFDVVPFLPFQKRSSKWIKVLWFRRISSKTKTHCTTVHKYYSLPQLSYHRGKLWQVARLVVLALYWTILLIKNTITHFTEHAWYLSCSKSSAARLGKNSIITEDHN